MKIIELKVSNIKKIKAIEIKPKDNVVIISGKNDQGKTSILDSIWYTLSGKASLKNTPIPIRKGEKTAEAILVLDDFIVSRIWTSNDKSYLKVTNREGLSYGSPQELLDSFIGRLTFDPLEFAQMKESEQRNLLLQVADIDIDYWDSGIMEFREKRRLQGQKVKLYEGERESVDISKLPEKEINTSLLQKNLENAIDHNRDIDDAKHNIDRNETAIMNSEAHILNLEEEIKTTKIEIKDLKNSLDIEKKFIKDNQKVDINLFRESINQALEVNEMFKAGARNIITNQKQKMAQAAYDDYTKKIEEIIKEKETALSNAKMPISGLGISETGVTYKDIPFGQLSSSEQLKVSMSIAMALNPKLKVLRITNGSLLDDDNMKLIKETANEKDYQVWIERVSDIGELCFIIEDGEIKNGSN